MQAQQQPHAGEMWIEKPRGRHTSRREVLVLWVTDKRVTYTRDPGVYQQVTLRLFLACFRPKWPRSAPSGDESRGCVRLWMAAYQLRRQRDSVTRIRLH